MSANRSRVRRDLRLYAKSQNPKFGDERERTRLQKLVEERLPARMARLHAEEGNDRQEAIEWTRLRNEVSSGRNEALFRPSAPPPPPSSVPPPVPSPEDLRRNTNLKQINRPTANRAGRAALRSEYIRELRDEVRDVVEMARDLAYMVNDTASQDIDRLGQCVSDAQDRVRDASAEMETAATSRSSSRLRTVRVLAAATGVGVAIVFGGGLGSAAYVAGAVGFGAIAALT